MSDSALIAEESVDTDEQLSASQILSRDLAAMLNVNDIDSVRSTQKVRGAHWILKDGTIKPGSSLVVVYSTNPPSIQLDWDITKAVYE